MKILLINNHHKIAGGTERYYFDLAKLLTEKGHKVAFFSTKGSGNRLTKWQHYFVDKVDFSKNGVQAFFSKLRRMFYSFDSIKKISALLDDFKPDIVHLQNIYYYISPSILSEIKRRKIPIVQTIHDYQLITPSVTFFHNGKICEITKPHYYILAFFHRCVKNSYLASLMAVIASYTQYFFKFYETSVDYFITPSLFMKNKLIEYGFNRKSVRHLNNFVYLNSQNSSNINRDEILQNKFVLYLGRFAEQKGVLLLLEAARKLPHITFKIIGFYETQKSERQMSNLIKKYKINNIEIKKFLAGQKLKTVISQCAFTVVPSLWYENHPYSILESYALQKAVIASSIGGIPEILQNGKTGLLFKPGDINDLTNKINFLWNNPDKTLALGRNAYKYVRSKFSPDAHYQKLLKIYHRAINNL